MKVRAGIFTTVTLLVGALMLGGCGGAGNESDTSGGAAPAEREEAGGGTGADTGGKRRDPKAGEPPRVVIHSGSLHLEVSDVGKAADEAADLALDADGAIGRDVRTSTDRYDEAKLTLRIPATQFAATLKELSALGKELERDISAEDVSEAMLDLDSRIASKRASVKRVRALLAQAQSLDEISWVEQIGRAHV